MVASDLLESSKGEKMKSILKCLGSAGMVKGEEEERLLASAPKEQPLESCFSKAEDLGFGSVRSTQG